MDVGATHTPHVYTPTFDNTHTRTRAHTRTNARTNTHTGACTRTTTQHTRTTRTHARTQARAHTHAHHQAGTCVLLAKILALEATQAEEGDLTPDRVTLLGQAHVSRQKTLD